MNENIKKYSIAIDGHSSSGKSTIAKGLAKLLRYKYVDTGATYRAITLKVINSGIDFDDIKNIKKILKNTTIDFKNENEKNILLLDGIDVEEKIRSLKISEKVSEISTIPEVRIFLVKLQRKLGKGKGVIMDGRDIGTVVMPDADFKFFITANEDVRASRRYKELAEKNSEIITYEEILQNIKKRDRIDSSRTHSPLTIAENAIIIDTSNMTIEEQLKEILNYINNNK
jgi:cytidylate kinase